MDDYLQLLEDPSCYRPASGDGRLAAVTLMVAPDYCILIERSPNAPKHAGQVALPGGRTEDSDLDLWDTARRETAEEVHVSLGRHQPYQQMPATMTGTGYHVHPFLVLMDKLPPHRPDNHEVENILLFPTPDLLDLTRYRLVSREQGLVETPWGPYHIWGATARIMYLAAHILNQN
jgi:ADP-ribose pyrophosphatase